MQSKIDRNQFIDEDTTEELLAGVTAIGRISDEYTLELKGPDPKSLERIKRELLSYYANYSYCMAKVYAKKGGNHTYYEDYKRRLRAEHMDDLISSTGKMTITRAEKEVEKYEPYYRDLDLLEDMRVTLIQFEKVDRYYIHLVNAVTQSIAVLRRDTETEY